MPTPAPVAPSQPTYQVSCPRCGGPLDPIALPDPQACPWRCPLCCLGWFAAELSPHARSLYRPVHNDFGFGGGRLSLVALVDQELAAAHVRGTSLREDQLSLVPIGALKVLKVRDASFAALIAQVLAAREA